MKNILIFSLLLSLTACSNSGSDAPAPASPESQIENLDAYGIGFFTGSPSVDRVEIEIPNVQVGIRTSVAVTIKNMATTATSLLTASIPTVNASL